METIHIIITGIILVVIILIYIKSQNKNKQIKQPQNISTEKLDFLDKNYESNKIKELQYLTSQQNENENDIKSSDLF